MEPLPFPTEARANRRMRGCGAALPILTQVPRPYSGPGLAAARASARPHAHRCASCGDTYSCSGDDETGACTPLCAGCYWLELGGQLSAYRAIIAAIERKRRQLERAAGPGACVRALERKRRTARKHGHAMTERVKSART